MSDPTKRIELNKLSLAILKACGITTDGHDIRAITYRHTVDEIPTLDVEYYAMPDWETFTLDGMELRATTVQFTPGWMTR